MRLEDLNLFLETATYTRGGESLEITFDLAAFHQPDYLRALSAGLRRLSAAADGVAAEEIERDIYAELLSSDKGYVIKEWSATDEGKPAPPTYENLKRLALRPLQDLFGWLKDKSIFKQEDFEDESG
jgi:hypothetical protein